MSDTTNTDDYPSMTREAVIDRLNKLLKLECGATIATSELVYCSWPQTFGSTCGPFHGIGGQALTTFRMEAWAWEQWAVVFCGGRVVSVGPFSIGAKYDRPS